MLFRSLENCFSVSTNAVEIRIWFLTDDILRIRAGFDVFMIVSGLLSTVDSNLCAVSSLTTDIAGGKDIRKTRAAMAVLLITGILIANIPGITVTHLFLFYGTLRASTLLPTVMTLKGVRLNAKGIITGVVAALAVGLPVFAYGSVLNSGPYKTLGSLLTVLLSGLIALAASGKERHYAR